MKTLSPLLAALSLSVPAVAGAAIEAPPLTATVGYAAQVVTNRAFDFAAGDDHLAMGRIAVGWELALPVGGVDLDFGYQSGSTDASVHSLTTAELTLRSLDLGATYRYPLLRHLKPMARLGLGYDWATMVLSGAGAELSQTIGHPSVNLLGGVTVPLVLRETQGGLHDLFVLDLGVGYAFRPSFDFDALAPEPPDKPDPDAVRRAPLALGSLGMSGIAYRLLFTLRL